MGKHIIYTYENVTMNPITVYNSYIIIQHLKRKEKKVTYNIGPPINARV